MFTFITDCKGTIKNVIHQQIIMKNAISSFLIISCLYDMIVALYDMIVNLYLVVYTLFPQYANFAFKT